MSLLFMRSEESKHYSKVIVNESGQVSKIILKFLYVTKEELKLKEELPWLSKHQPLRQYHISM